MTGIGAAFLAPERLGERGLTPSSLTYAPTGERVASEARLRELRQTDPGGLAIIELLDEDDPADRKLLMRSLTFPGAIVASDAMPLTWTGPAPDPLTWPLPTTAITHPRTPGPFSGGLRLLTRSSTALPRREARWWTPPTSTAAGCRRRSSAAGTPAARPRSPSRWCWRRRAVSAGMILRTPAGSRPGI